MAEAPSAPLRRLLLHASLHFNVHPRDVCALVGAPRHVVLMVRGVSDLRAAGAFETWAAWNAPASVRVDALRVRAFPDLPEEALEAALLLGGVDGLRALVEVDDG